MPLDPALLRLAVWTAVAPAWESPFWRVVDPEKPLPFWTSTQQVPWLVKGLVPVSEPRSRRRVTDTIVAPSGIDAVLNDTTVRYWRSWLLSPTRSALLLLPLSLSEPPALVFSPDSSTQPSSAPAEMKVTVVGAGFTTCGVPPLVPLLFNQPLAPVKAAVRVWLPTESAVVLNAACPEPLTGTLEAHVVAPSVKVTVPAGTPLPEVTVAVKVTDCPKADGLGAEASAVLVAMGANGVAEASFEAGPSPDALVAVTT